MICHNSVGYDAQIKDLLIKSAFNMDKKEIDAWMKYQYDPQHMFCFWQDDKITSCLQVTKRTMMFLDRQMRVSVIGMAATLPDYRQRKQLHTQTCQNYLRQKAFNTFQTQKNIGLELHYAEVVILIM